MATSWLTRWFTNKVRPVRRPVRKKIDHGRFLPQVEPLDERLLPAVTATFSAAAGQLRIVGDELDNTIVVSRDAAGTILVNAARLAASSRRTSPSERVAWCRQRAIPQRPRGAAPAMMLLTFVTGTVTDSSRHENGSIVRPATNRQPGNRVE